MKYIKEIYCTDDITEICEGYLFSAYIFLNEFFLIRVYQFSIRRIFSIGDSLAQG